MVAAGELDVPRVGMFRAYQRAFSTWQIRSSTAWRMSVGTRIDGATARTSISKAIRMNASAELGVAALANMRPSQSATHGAGPMLGKTSRGESSSTRPQWSGRSARYASSSSSVLSPHGQSSSVRSRTSAPWRMSARVRSGCAAAKRIESGPPSDSPITAARSEPTASITARMSSIRVSSVVAPATRSLMPRPRLSKRMSRLNSARRSQNRP